MVAEHEAHERMPLFINACDALVLASDAEGSPMVIKEAMACNLPIVSVDVGDVAEIIGKTPGCRLVARDASALAAGLAQALRFRRTYRRTRRYYAAVAGRIAARLEAIYREMTGL